MAPRAKSKGASGKAKAKAKSKGAAKAQATESPGAASEDICSNTDAALDATDSVAVDPPVLSDTKADIVVPEAEAGPESANPSTSASSNKEEVSGSNEKEICAEEEPTILAPPWSLDELSDAWDGLSLDDAFRKVREEDWEVIEATSSSASGAAHIAAKDSDLASFSPPLALAGKVVSLDISGNQLKNLNAVAPLWVRNLSLGNNPLSSLDGLADAFPKLLVIDLSYVEIESVDGAWSALASCPELRALTAESSGISSFQDVEPMLKLQILELPENGVEDLDDLQTLGKACKNLIELDLRENPVAQDNPKAYKEKVKKFFPLLKMHDNNSTKKFVAIGRDKVNYEGIMGDRAQVDGLFKNESCSCLEGNPCTDPATCKDWHNRDKVAAEARKLKMPRDEWRDGKASW